MRDFNQFDRTEKSHRYPLPPFTFSVFRPYIVHNAGGYPLIYFLWSGVTMTTAADKITEG